MHLAAKDRVVPQGAKVMRQRRNRRVEFGAVVEGIDHGRQPAREHGKARGGADRRIAIGGIEDDAAFGEPRDVGCLHQAVSIDGQSRGSKLIGHYQQDVRSS